MRVVVILVSTFFCACSLCGQSFLKPDVKSKDGKLGGRWLLGNAVFELVEVSTAEQHAGECSIHLKDTNPGKSNECLSLYLTPSELQAVRGKTIRLSAWIKKVDGRCGVGLWCKKADGSIVSRSEEVQIQGGGDWGQYSVSMLIPADAKTVVATLGCAGGWGNMGEAYFDEMDLAIVPPAMTIPAGGGSRLALFDDAWRPHWRASSSGGLTAEMVELSAFKGVAGVRLRAAADIKPNAGALSIFTNLDNDLFFCEGDTANRHLDLTAFRDSGGWLEFYVKPFVPMNVCGVSVDKKSAVAVEDGWYLCRIPLKALDGRFHCANAGSLTLQFPQAMKKGAMVQLDEIAFVSEAMLEAPEFKFRDQDTADSVAKACVFGGPLPADKFNRPEIKDGTFLYQGAPFFFMGPWFSNSSLHTDFGSHTFRAATNARAFYNQVFDKPIAEELGFSSIQISSAPWIPMAHAMALPISRVDGFMMEPGFYKGLGGMPAVLDFAWLNDAARLADAEPSFPKEAFQQKAGFRTFVPFCPEHPLGKEIYREYLRRGAYSVLKNGGNPFLYELFNESAYDCRCEFNKRAFLDSLKKNYGDIASANRVWGGAFASFETAVFMKGKYESCPGLFVDWCKFSGDRYAVILKELSEVIRSVDKRKNVYFTEQISHPNILDSNGAGMNYRKIAEVLDVLGNEGGYKFGDAAEKTKTNDMEEAMNTGRHDYALVADLFTALGKNRKPVVNDEHYCLRMRLGKRVPSKKQDIITSMWCEVFHGVSASYVYAWARRAWEWHSLDEAKRTVVDGGPNDGYKGANLLNPYNYPVEAIDGFKDFKEELEPLRELALPMPRLKAAKVAFVHSYPTLRLSTVSQPFFDNRKVLTSWYGALLCGNYPFEALFEEDATSPALSRYQAVVIPCMKNSYAATLPALAEYVKNGGVVICGKASFAQDEHGKPLDSAKFLGLERRPLENAVKERAAGGVASRVEDIVPVTARTFIASETGKPLVLLNRAGKGKVYYFSCELPERGLKNTLSAILKAEGLAKCLEVEAEDGLPLDSLEAQVIDRGDVKLVMLVNWEDEGTRFVRLKLKAGMDGSSVVDPAAKAQYVLGNGELSWSKAALESGVLVSLPPQTRQLFLIRKGGAQGRILRTLTPEDIKSAFSQARAEDQAELDAKAKAQAAAQAERAKARSYESVDEAKCVFLDLRRFANMGFRDDVDGDQKGGWFDQGPNDFRNMPLGRLTLSGISFQIIDPSGNGGKAAIIIQGAPKPFFPANVEGIPVDSTAKNIYFLHTAGWGGAKGRLCHSYIARYEDGSSLEIPIVFGVKIGGWWNPVALPEAKIALDAANPVCDHVGLFCCRWNNPHPDKRIKSLDIVSAKADAVPAIVAITVEKP